MSNTTLWGLILSGGLLIVIAFHFLKVGKVSKAVAGFVLWQSVDNWIDFIVYPAVLIALGPLKGFLAMVALTLVGNLVYMAINKTTEVDWTFIEKMNGFSWVKKATAWKISSWAPGRVIIFFVLSLKFDSFIATTFLYGKKINFRSVGFWGVFFGSHMIANLLWTGGWETILLTAKMLVGT